MDAIQLRAELFREMNPLLDSEVAMTKVIMFVKGLVNAQKKEAGITIRKGWAAARRHMPTARISCWLPTSLRMKRWRTGNGEAV